MGKDLFIVDRTEGNFVICEDFLTGNIVEIPLENITSKFEEGDVLIKKENTYTIDIQKTIKRKVQINTKFDSIW